MKKYILIDNDGDILADDPKYREPNKPFFQNYKKALSDAESIALRREKRDKIYIFQLIHTIKGTE